MSDNVKPLPGTATQTRCRDVSHMLRGDFQHLEDHLHLLLLAIRGMHDAAEDSKEEVVELNLWEVAALRRGVEDTLEILNDTEKALSAFGKEAA